jgi:hypothetical protein
MKMETPTVALAAISVEKKTGNVKQNPWLRASAFVLSAASGFLFARLLHLGFTLLPTLTDGAQEKAGPLVAILKLLRSGLGN